MTWIFIGLAGIFLAVDMMPTFIGLAVVFLALRAIYRLYFHPLAKIPGPKLAAISSLPEFYYDVIRDGRYLWQVEKMHKKYGPVVRINPYQVHINDPSFYGEICASGGRKRDKSFAAMAGLRSTESLPSIIDHDHHNLRRKHLNPAFSKKSIVELVPMIQRKIAMVMEDLETAYKTADPVVDLEHEFTGLTADTVTEFTYGKDLGFLRDKQFNNVILGAMREMTDQFHVNRFFPFLTPLLSNLPPWFMCQFRPKLAGIYELQKRINQEPVLKDQNHKTVMDTLTDPSMPPEVRSPEFIRETVNIILGAATEPTSGTLLMGIYQLAQQRPLWLKLREELKTVMPTPTDAPSWLQLEQLPLMRAVFHEVLRFSPGTIRIARVATQETLVCQGHVMAPGSTVSASARLIHMHEDPFPDPHSFNPNRWLEADPKQHNKMLQALVPFSKGPRNCIGYNLVTAEVYMVLAAIIRRFDVELYDTTAANVAFERDCVVARPVAGFWNVKVRLTGVATV